MKDMYSEREWGDGEGVRERRGERVGHRKEGGRRREGRT